jgi:hypothetical protein
VWTVLLCSAACSPAPAVELAHSSGGTAIEAEAQHSMSIDRAGGVTIDGAVCRTEPEGRAALERVAQSMRSNEELADRAGVLRVPDEPLLVRIDGDARLADVGWWLFASQTSSWIHRTRLAVRDAATGAELALVVDVEPRAQAGCAALDADWASRVKLVGPRVQALIEASDRASWSADGRVPRWRVVRWIPLGGGESAEFDTWSAVRAELERTPDDARRIFVEGVLPADMRWREVLPVVAELLERWRADVSFSSTVAPALGR